MFMPNVTNIFDTTRNLIRFRTTPDRPEEIKHCLEYVQDFMIKAGWSAKDYVCNGSKSLYFGENLKPKVLFAAHLDVVPGDDRQFEPREDNGRLYGRGALDMKSGTAALMHLAAEIGPNSELGFMVTTDEESGGFNGSKFLLEQGLRPQVVILPDGGKDWRNIVLKEKGVLWLKLVSHGKAAHGSTPWQGANAILKLNRALESIQTLFAATSEHPQDHWIATCNVGLIEGGAAANKVADSAGAVCDIRLTEHDDPQKIISEISARLPEGIELEKLLDEPMVFVPQDHPAVLAYAEAIRSQGGTPNFILEHGSSDARFFMPFKIPVILSQPIGDGHHGKDEWVDITSMNVYRDTVRQFLRAFAGL